MRFAISIPVPVWLASTRLVHIYTLSRYFAPESLQVPVVCCVLQLVVLAQCSAAFASALTYKQTASLYSFPSRDKSIKVSKGSPTRVIPLIFEQMMTHHIPSHRHPFGCLHVIFDLFKDWLHQLFQRCVSADPNLRTVPCRATWNFFFLSGLLRRISEGQLTLL